MNHDTKTSFLVFLFVLAALTLSQRSHAALSLAPMVPGLSGGQLTGTGHTLTASNDGYIKPAITNVGGRAITVPARLRMAANAGTIAKTAMRLNPALLVGSAALLWLIENNFGVEDGELVRMIPGTMYEPIDLPGQLFSDPDAAGAAACAFIERDYSRYSGGFYYCSSIFGEGAGRSMTIHNNPPTTSPATAGDMDTLPPLPASVIAELPDADYLPGGVPVEAPEYDFIPFSVPLGQPYEKPDGSTAQPMAKVSPDDERITVDTYDMPVTDTNGDPVANPVPEDTPEPAPETQTDCEKFPASIGCMELGTVTNPALGTENRSIASIAPVSIGGAGSCPAPLTASFMGQPISFSYDMPCSFATSLKPLILAIAWLSAGLIFIGGVRQ